jgi:cytochrome bd-type quinol oxidase subunit 1
MKKIQPYVTDWHAIMAFIIVALFVAYKAAYQYLNPDNFQWQNAIFYAALAVVGLFVYGHGHVSTQLKVARIVDALPVAPATKQGSGEPPTRPMPAIPLEDSPDQFMPPR